MVRASITDFGFNISGHANFDENGYDIVCSAISALSQSIALSLQRKCSVTIQATNGWLTVDVKKPNQTSFILLDTLRIGLEEIQKKYPEHIKMRVKKGVFQ